MAQLEAETLHRLASALGCESTALEEVLADPALEAEVLRHRIGPALVLMAREMGVDGPLLPALEAQFRRQAARHVGLRRALGEAAETLDRAEIPWAPLKGMGLEEVYPLAGERPCLDIDLLIGEEDLPRAREVLEDAGWRPKYRGARYEDLLASEDYVWCAFNRDGVLLEVHFRLWGSVPRGLGRAVFERAKADSRLGAFGRRIDLADAYLVAAVHLWLTPPPRPLILLWDLDRFARMGGESLVEELCRRTEAEGLVLFVILAASGAADLWRYPVNRAIVNRLSSCLETPERLVFRRLRDRAGEASLAVLALARLVAGRPSRGGVHALLRRLWPHPALVERSTPETWPWAGRRAVHQMRHLPIVGRTLRPRAASGRAPQS